MSFSLVSWDVLRLVRDGCPISYSTFTFIHTDACIPLYVSPIFLAAFLVFLIFRDSFAYLLLQVPHPLFGFSWRLHSCRIVLHMGRDSHTVSSKTTQFTCLFLTTRWDARPALGVADLFIHVLLFILATNPFACHGLADTGTFTSLTILHAGYSLIMRLPIFLFEL